MLTYTTETWAYGVLGIVCALIVWIGGAVAFMLAVDWVTKRSIAEMLERDREREASMARHPHTKTRQAWN